ncbi:MAG: FAD-dependent monooxygenase [Bacteroidaceae bacterium]|nr:FAD-dependent monooxygenase [Bacteroidaceae bacterium]
MEIIHFNTLIIGGGPSGSSCGIRLRKEGAECCIVDRRTFPRTKLCAGLFTHKSQQCLRHLLGEEDYSKAINTSLMSQEARFSLYRGMDELVTCDLTDRNLQPKQLRDTDCRIMLLSRPKLDEFLLRHFQKMGGTVMEGDALKAVDFESKTATLSSGRQIQFDNLIAADGANSSVERLLAKHDSSFKKRPDDALCLEINVDREDLNMDGVRIYFDIVPNSYAWVFAKGEKTCIGLVKEGKEGKESVSQIMTSFCRKIGVKNMEKYPLKGAMLPFNSLMEKPAYKDFLYFIGDAAGLVTLPTGEGIYFALQSGVYAAESVLSQLHTEQYLKKVEYLHRIIHRGQYYQKLLETPRYISFLYRHASRNARFITYFYLTQIERASHEAFWKVVLRYKIGK